jgi:LuxR family maltose regulon positive regulatory protein
MFSAESAYLSFHLEEANRYAYQCLYKAEANAQHDLVCNSYRLLARIGYMQGDYAEMVKQIDSAIAYADSHENSVMRNIRDATLAWYYLKLRDHQKVPQSILDFSKTELHNLAYGRPQVTYAHYLLNAEEYARMVAMMRHTNKGLQMSRGIWQESIVRHIMLAVGYYCLGDTDASVDALWSAYDLSYNNGLVTLFIEAGECMNKIIQAARKQQKYAFSREWLDFIDQETSAFAVRARLVRAVYRKDRPEKTNTENPLSKREQAVLQAIARGQTREEIAVSQYISLNTVKSTLRNIYNKLDAHNKAEAVSIAIMSGYIERYTST